MEYALNFHIQDAARSVITSLKKCQNVGKYSDGFVYILECQISPPPYTHLIFVADHVNGEKILSCETCILVKKCTFDVRKSQPKLNFVCEEKNYKYEVRCDEKPNFVLCRDAHKGNILLLMISSQFNVWKCCKSGKIGVDSRFTFMFHKDCTEIGACPSKSNVNFQSKKKKHFVE